MLQPKVYYELQNLETLLYGVPQDQKHQYQLCQHVQFFQLAPTVKEAVNLVIPKARAKVSLRLPPTEDPDHAMKMLEEHIMKNIPWDASVKFIPNSKGSGVVADPNKPFTTELVNSFNSTWENETAYIGVGGSIPFANDFVREFPNAELVLIGAADEELGNAHAPNESVQIDHIEMLIESLVNTLKNI